MNACQIIHGLEQLGYELTAVGDKVRGDWQDMLPPPPESVGLLEELRNHKGEVIDELMRRAFTVVPPKEGDSYSITFEGEAATKRWAVAEQAGLVHLTDTVRVEHQSGQCRINFRCTMPLDWLEDAITAECKQQYNGTAHPQRRGVAQGEREQHGL